MSRPRHYADDYERLDGRADARRVDLPPLTDAQRALAESMARFVRAMARRVTPGRWLTVEDLEAEGYLQACRSAVTFEPGRGLKFSTYAAPGIVGAMKRAVRDSMPWPRLWIPEWNAALAALAEHGTPEAARESLGWRKDHWDAVMERGLPVMSSLDHVLYNGGEPASTLLETIPDHRPTPEEALADTRFEALRDATLHQALAGLPPREQMVARLMYWEGCSHEQILAITGLTPGQVNKSLVRLKAALKAALIAEHGESPWKAHTPRRRPDRKGQPSPNKGKKWTPEQRERHRLALTRRHMKAPGAPMAPAAPTPAGPSTSCMSACTTDAPPPAGG